MIKLRDFCINAPLKVLKMSLVLGLGFGYYLYHTYVGEEMGISFGRIILFSLYNILCALASYTILLNRVAEIRDNILLSFISFFWFALPQFIIFFIMDDPLLIIIAKVGIMPFLLVQSVYFVRFRFLLRSGRLLDNNGNVIE